ncbi:MAG: tRNA adenosine(34) deaminase TadA [Acidobacteriota bacterium]
MAQSPSSEDIIGPPPTIVLPSPSDDDRWMMVALDAADHAARQGDVPVGAVVVHDGRIIGRSGNRREQDQDPTGHAELVALRQAARHLGHWRLVGCALYVTLEPCAMCAGALVNSRVDLLVYGASDPKGGFCGSLGNLVRDPRLNHRLDVRSGVLAEASRTRLKAFFAERRRQTRRPRSL